MNLPLAHSGHWAASLLYLTPVVFLTLTLRLQSWKERRRARQDAQNPPRTTEDAP